MIKFASNDIILQRGDYDKDEQLDDSNGVVLLEIVTHKLKADASPLFGHWTSVQPELG
jgi:hypothetical protein